MSVFQKVGPANLVVALGGGSGVLEEAGEFLGACHGSWVPNRQVTGCRRDVAGGGWTQGRDSCRSGKAGNAGDWRGCHWKDVGRDRGAEELALAANLLMGTHAGAGVGRENRGKANPAASETGCRQGK